ncbi:unnamed protein product, partial [Symbiodinium pilosum]
HGGDSRPVRAQLCGVCSIQASQLGSAFAAVRCDGGVVTWGGMDCGGDSDAVASQLRPGSCSDEQAGQQLRCILESGKAAG